MFATFAADFDLAFASLRNERRGSNLVSLAALQAALSGYDRGQFLGGLLRLRIAGAYVLEMHDGRHARATPEMLAASIVEDGRRFVYASRREA